MYTHGQVAARTVVALYSMILNGYAPAAVMLFGEHQWTPEARALLTRSLPFAEIVPTEHFLAHVAQIGGAHLAEAARRHWFVFKAFVALLYPPEESCLMDDDVFILDEVREALGAFERCDLVYTPDFDWGGSYLEAWGSIDSPTPLPTGAFNAGLYWLRQVHEPRSIAAYASRSRPDTTAAYVWEQGFIAALYGTRGAKRLGTQRYLYPLWDGLPGGVRGYDYETNPSGFASVHFGGLIEKPSDSDALALAPAILGRNGTAPRLPRHA